MTRSRKELKTARRAGPSASALSKEELKSALLSGSQTQAAHSFFQLPETGDLPRVASSLPRYKSLIAIIASKNRGKHAPAKAKVCTCSKLHPDSACAIHENKYQRLNRIYERAQRSSHKLSNRKNKNRPFAYPGAKIKVKKVVDGKPVEVIKETKGVPALRKTTCKRLLRLKLQEANGGNEVNVRNAVIEPLYNYWSNDVMAREAFVIGQRIRISAHPYGDEKEQVKWCESEKMQARHLSEGMKLYFSKVFDRQNPNADTITVFNDSLKQLERESSVLGMRVAGRQKDQREYDKLQTRIKKREEEGIDDQPTAEQVQHWNEVFKADTLGIRVLDFDTELLTSKLKTMKVQLQDHMEDLVNRKKDISEKEKALAHTKEEKEVTKLKKKIEKSTGALLNKVNEGVKLRKRIEDNAGQLKAWEEDKVWFTKDHKKAIRICTELGVELNNQEDMQA